MKHNMLLLSIFLLATLITGWVNLAEAQQTGKVYRIGYLTRRHESHAYTKAFRQGLRELGYIEGQNIVIEWRFAEGDRNRLPGLADELIKLRVDCIFAGTRAATRAAKKATRTIPIVMGAIDDPVGNGFVASLARPGGNITGMSSRNSELADKRLELLKEAFPHISRVAVLGDSSRRGYVDHFKRIETSARVLGIETQSLEVERPYEFDNAFRAAINGRAEGLIVRGVGIGGRRDRAQLVKLAAKYQLPAMYTHRRFVAAGGLMSYEPSRHELHRRAATFVDKILKGANPGDLPVERATKFELLINLKSAKQLEVTIQPEVLYRADKVIR